jgi:hypothetical protein
MVDASYYDGPAAGFGDAIVVRESRLQRDGLFGGLVAVFALAFIRGFAGAQTGGGRVAVTIFTAAVIASLVVGWIAIVSRRSRLEISRATISRVSKRRDRLVLSRQAGDRLRIVHLGSGRFRRPGLAIEGTDQVLPLDLFSVREVKQACQSKGWEFAGLPFPPRALTTRRAHLPPAARTCHKCAARRAAEFGAKYGSN